MTRSEASLLSPSVVRLTGRDVVTVLQNIATQRFDDLAMGEARLAVFCDFRGRLLHRVVAARVDDAMWLVREDAPGATLAAYLDRNVFREDMKIEDLSAAWQVRSFPEMPGTEGRVERTGSSIRIEIARGPRYELAPLEHGAAINSVDWEARRIAAGWARHGHEITEDFHPFEVNLGHAVHLDKGCFTGHETLMRLVTYRSVRRRLVRLEGRGTPAAPADIKREGKVVGRLTSVAGTGGAWTGLTVIKHEASEVGTVLEIEGTQSTRVAESFTVRSPGARELKL